MTLHFSYGANMSRAIMRRHARDAAPLGVAELADHRFVITGDGYASVEPARGETVHGVLWRITPRDRVTLDAWENVSAGLYRAETVPVRHAGELMPALVYFARSHGEGRPKPGYIELVIAAARQWNLPPRHIRALETWLDPRPLGAGNRKLEGAR
ncbi:MAG: gamma-glutamylcyclotransferase [Xanthobacteraceae bacterium]|nr:gamma-glutamylcyclotransferase [Xanthobacteraceae bacterium]